jgi:hypothetical protein
MSGRSHPPPPPPPPSESDDEYYGITPPPPPRSAESYSGSDSGSDSGSEIDAHEYDGSYSGPDSGSDSGSEIDAREYYASQVDAREYDGPEKCYGENPCTIDLENDDYGAIMRYTKEEGLRTNHGLGPVNLIQGTKYFLIGNKNHRKSRGQLLQEINELKNKQNEFEFNVIDVI